ncbi:MAG: transcription-repair coupling factor [Deltaproteobacteria bacterium]|nr:transcription-repair coupling factor [Deltaproteobacteria bacterium]
MNVNQYLARLKEWVDGRTGEFRVTGIAGTARAFFLAQLLVETERPCLIILPGAKDAARLYRELEFFLPESLSRMDPGKRRLYDFPAYDISPLAGLSPHRNVVRRRLQALYALTSGKDPIVVTSMDAILFRILPKQAMIDSLEYLETGEEVVREDLLKRLEADGYLRTSLVEEMGDYSVRGGVIDIFAPLYPEPIRLEFWGDHLESIRHFDPSSQISTDRLKEMLLLPSNEIIMDRDKIERARSMGRVPEQLKVEGSFSGQEAWLKHFYTRLDTLFDYLPQEGLVTLFEPFRIESERERLTDRFLGDVERYHHEAEERRMPFPETDGILVPGEEMGQILEQYQRVSFIELAIDRGDTTSGSMNIRGVSSVDDDLEIRLAGKGKVSMAPLAEKIAEWRRLGSRVILVCRTGQQAGRLKEILHNYELEIDAIVEHWYRISPRKNVSICLGRLSKGFAWPELGIYVVSEDEIFGPKRSRAGKAKRATDRGLDWTSFSQLKVGNLVVHQDHGIGRYGGLIKMEVEQKVNDFVIIEYVGNDRLYTPADRISVMQKYMGGDDRDPKLDRLGGRSWNLAKKKAKRSVMEIARQLVGIYALRKYRKGFEFSRPDNYFREFEATFEHEETPDQIKAIDDVLADMESDRPMDRLVCGDVGFGKTEIAIRAAFKAVMDGKQAALLVPTTILAEQHYETFRRRMEPYQLKVGVLSRFKSRKEQKELLAEARSGRVDVLIGTHRLLQKDVSFKELGLVIIDEEQRFGVRQKEKLKKYRALVDVLALTATPIPRTLHLSLMGVRDLSIIETPPEDRQAIQTYLMPYDESTIRSAIEREKERGGQVFFVHNRVKDIDQIAGELKRLVPETVFAVAHGQMKEKELEDTMIRFLRKEIDVLVCTTIIESGLDIPSSNTIIINKVDQFGLSQIYQLRGRVGRSTENAYAYLLLSGDSRMTREAEKRLKALMDFSHLGAGIRLAMHDLKIRGGGNILGFSQSGHIAAIGYELYLKMIEQSISELKGEEMHEEINPEINVDISAYLPEEYVSDIDVRLNLYRRLSGLNEEADLKAMIEEMGDRFGPPSEPVSNLLNVMAVRLEMKKMRVSRLDVNREALVFNFDSETSVDPERLVSFVGRNMRRFQFLSETRLKVRVFKESALEALLEARRIIRELGDLLKKEPNPF